jgi:hypothetical protein
MMEICLDAVDSQIAKLEEFVLVAHRIRKAGRGARPGPNKFKLSPRKRRAHPSLLLDEREKLTHSQRLFRFGIARARRSSFLNNLSSS